MLSSLKVSPLKGFMLKPCSVRHMSTGTASIKDRFQEAWLSSTSKSTGAAKKEPKDKKLYGSGYIKQNVHRMKRGYTHPYHSKEHPLSVTSGLQYYDTLNALVGPEQVSPHYESLSRSRRGLLFMFAYIGTITGVARLGGWDFNEWIRGMVFHHEYLIALFVGFAEVRHFAWIPGPKFSIFYDVFTRYEMTQLASQWSDTAEEFSKNFYNDTKLQVDYMSIHKEYNFVKKRAMINFMTNERQNLEKHFHERTVNMLNQISGYEQQNMRNKLISISQQAFEATLKRIDNDDGEIKEQAFTSALEGLRKGRMDFKSDPILPIMEEELSSRTSSLRNLSAEEESKLLSLTSDQRKSVVQMDRAVKEGYISTVPHMSSQGLKSHDKFQKFVDYLAGLNKKDLA